MIKDSKLIGTKIKAPFGWKKFKVGELFDVCTTIGFDAGKLVFTDSGVPFIGRTDSNYGIQGYLRNMLDSKPNPSNVISISQIGSQSAQYRKTVWYASQNMFYVELLNYDLTLDSGLFFVGIFNKILQKYLGYTSYPTKNSIFNWMIELPVTVDNQPDFVWMSDYIKAVKADYLEQKALLNRNEIEAYLSAGNIDSTDITDDDRQFLRDFAKLPRRKFKVGELFDIKLSRSDNKITELSKGDIPLISAGADNQGIVGYIDSDLLNTVPFKNSITADMFGNWFLHVGDFYAVSHGRVNILVPKFMFNELLCEYVCVLGSKCTVGYYGFDNMLSSKKLSDIVLELPVIDSSQVDMKSIEKYMQIQSKPLINNVVNTLVPVGGGQALIDFVAIEKYMQIQIKLTIGKHAKYLDKELALMRTV